MAWILNINLILIIRYLIKGIDQALTKMPLPILRILHLDSEGWSNVLLRNGENCLFPFSVFLRLHLLMKTLLMAKLFMTMHIFNSCNLRVSLLAILMWQRANFSVVNAKVFLYLHQEKKRKRKSKKRETDEASGPVQLSKVCSAEKPFNCLIWFLKLSWWWK